MRLLLDHGADPLAQDCNQRNPLHFAAEGGHLSCVNALIDAILAPPEPPPAAPGAPAPRRRISDPMFVHRPDQNGQAPVNIAAEAHFVEVVAALLDAVPHGADGYYAGPRDAEAKTRSALHLAAAQGWDDVVPHLLASHRLHPGAKDADGWTPLHHAAAGGHSAIVSQLMAQLPADADDPVATDGDTPLHKAALGGHADAVTALLRGRCQVDATNASGSTALYNAASQGHLAVVTALVDAGAAVDAATANGCTPLYIAANNGFAGEFVFSLFLFMRMICV